MFSEHAPLLQELSCKLVGLELSDSQLFQFCQYGDLLVDWNQKLNLTRIVIPQEVILKHFVDSLVLAKFISKTSFVDLGTGAGFPGIPLKIIKPGLNVILVDSLKKRLEFLDVVIQTLKLQEIRTIHSRAEDFGRDSRYRERFDIVSSRAMARLPVLLEYALPLLKNNGVFLAPKGLKVEEEVKESQRALTILGGKIEAVENYTLGESAEHRAIVLVRKIMKTPSIYPRKAGTPSKNPLY